MGIENYVKRCKYVPKNKEKFSETFLTLHAADNDKTLCGKELNEMWYVISSSGLSPEDITCKKCIKALIEAGLL
jgi:hypothetical protein